MFNWIGWEFENYVQCLCMGFLINQHFKLESVLFNMIMDLRTKVCRGQPVVHIQVRRLMGPLSTPGRQVDYGKLSRVCSLHKGSDLAVM